jgi:hypothetical protein
MNTAYPENKAAIEARRSCVRGLHTFDCHELDNSDLKEVDLLNSDDCEAPKVET